MSKILIPMDDVVPGSSVEVDVADTNLVSDGYHTFGELYEHRCLLFIMLMGVYDTAGDWSWRSRKHDDGSEMPGWFVAGINLPTGPITYHLPESMWEMLDPVKFGATVQTLDRAPKWDGHTSQDVCNRIREFIEVTQ